MKVELASGDIFEVPRFTGKTGITGKTAEIPERPKNNRETLINIFLVVHFDIIRLGTLRFWSFIDQLIQNRPISLLKSCFKH